MLKYSLKGAQELKEDGKKIKNVMYEKNINKEIENTKRDQKIPELKSTINTMKNSLLGVNVRSA